jgi:antitoxin CcdA
MGYDRNAARRATNLSLNEDLVRRARALSPDLSATVERLLAEHVERQDAGKQARIDAAIAAHNAFVREHGLVGEEFDPV